MPTVAPAENAQTEEGVDERVSKQGLGFSTSIRPPPENVGLRVGQIGVCIGVSRKPGGTASRTVFPSATRTPPATRTDP
jgi:hypothetical protein